jgi:hypothetical protein
MPWKSKLKTLKTVETLTHDEATRKHIPTAEYQPGDTEGGTGAGQGLTRDMGRWYG